MLSNSGLNNFIIPTDCDLIFYNQLSYRDEFYNKIHIKLRHEPTVEITFTYHLSSPNATNT